MIALLGPRPFEKHDPYDEAMLNGQSGGAGGAPLPLDKRQPKTAEQTQEEKERAPLGEGIEAGGGVSFFFF
jgi:hypothetical protein